MVGVKRFRGWGMAAVMLLVACGEGDSSADTSDAPSDPANKPAVVTPAVPATSTSPPATVNAEAPPLAGSDWTVNLYQEGVAMVELWPGTEITLSFGEDGTISGLGGCNNYTGTFVVEGPYDPFEEQVRDDNDGQIIHITVDSVTERFCESPGGTMDQESVFLEDLAAAGRWLIARDKLSLRTPEGGFLIEALPVG